MVKSDAPQAKTSYPVEALQGGDDRGLIEASHWGLKAHPGHVFLAAGPSEQSHKYTHTQTHFQAVEEE